jgi:hypothetical protein
MANMMTASLRASATRALRSVDRRAMSSAQFCGRRAVRAGEWADFDQSAAHSAPRRKPEHANEADRGRLISAHGWSRFPAAADIKLAFIWLGLLDSEVRP